MSDSRSGESGSIAPDRQGGRTYLFSIRPTEDDPRGLPKAWWLPGALGPVATLLATRDGLWVIRRSAYGTALQLGVGIGVGVGLMFGLWLPIAYLIPTRLGVTVGSHLLGLTVAFLSYFGVIVGLYPRIRKLAAWRPLGPFVRILVLSASLGAFHQEMHIEGDGQGAWVRTNARRATIEAALRLAHQMPPESDVSRKGGSPPPILP